MNVFFAILVAIFFTGVVGGRERVEVKRGEKVVLVEKKSGLENLSRLTLSEDNADGKREGETTDYIFNYCSPKEKERGCTNKNSSTFSFENGKDGVFLTPLNASDGCYFASIFGHNLNEKKVLIVVNGTLPRTISPDPPPSQENPEARETPGIVDPSTLVIIAVGIAVVIIAVGIAVVIIAVVILAGSLAWWCLKKKKNKQSEASDFKKYHIKESAGEQTTGDSFEMVDRTPPSEDEDNNSPIEVLIHDTSPGQENERPGQHLQNNNYSEDEDDNSKHNIINNYFDSDFCSNDDEDYDDDEIKSNNTNNYLNNNNNDDGVANGGGDDDDDDGISRGDDSIKTN